MNVFWPEALVDTRAALEFAGFKLVDRLNLASVCVLPAERLHPPPSCKVLLLVETDSPRSWYEAARLDTVGLICRSCPPELAVETVQMVLEVPSRIPRTLAPPTYDQLTSREGELWQLLAEGVEYAAIAERWKVRKDTVNSHRKSLFQKLDVSSRAEAVAIYPRSTS